MTNFTVLVYRMSSLLGVSRRARKDFSELHLIYGKTGLLHVPQ